MTNKQKAIAKIEWQTCALLSVNYFIFILLCLNYQQLPWWFVSATGAMIVCLHGSLQHEIIHGHPTRSKFINEWLVFPALGLWLPYEIYRDTHLKHHRDEYITDPFEDPESYFVDGTAWLNMGSFRRTMFLIRNTVVGRLLLGPLWTSISFVIYEAVKLVQGDFLHLRYWAWHILSVSLLLIWLHHCSIPPHEYVFLIAYPGLSLTMLRSFLEHQAHPDPAKRTAVVESGKLMSLLFLNNNLHALHHENPVLPWYLLPRIYNERSNEILGRNGGYHYPGYFNIIRRYSLSPKTHPRHPFV